MAPEEALGLQGPPQAASPEQPLPPEAQQMSPETAGAQMQQALAAGGP